jgi:N-ethylmaleimide reductase
MKTKNLFSPTRLGPYTLKNRVVLPPLTRSRSSQPGDIPNELIGWNITHSAAVPGLW